MTADAGDLGPPTGSRGIRLEDIYRSVQDFGSQNETLRVMTDEKGRIFVFPVLGFDERTGRFVPLHTSALRRVVTFPTRFAIEEGAANGSVIIARPSAPTQAPFTRTIRHVVVTDIVVTSDATPAVFHVASHAGPGAGSVRFGRVDQTPVASEPSSLVDSPKEIIVRDNDAADVTITVVNGEATGTLSLEGFFWDEEVVE